MKPSEFKVVKAKKGFLLLPGFRAITWKGIVYCKNNKDVELINTDDSINSDFESHESIHIRQAECTKDSWFIFYSLYLWQWLCNFVLFIYGLLIPYKFIAFELEAVANEANHDYAMHGAVYQWKKFNRLSLKQKCRFAKDYKSKKRIMRFSTYVKEFIVPSLESVK